MESLSNIIKDERFQFGELLAYQNAWISNKVGGTVYLGGVIRSVEKLSVWRFVKNDKKLFYQ